MLYNVPNERLSCELYQLANWQFTVIPGAVCTSTYALSKMSVARLLCHPILMKRAPHLFAETNGGFILRVVRSTGVKPYSLDVESPFLTFVGLEPQERTVLREPPLSEKIVDTLLY